jgi:hypothetical protein
MLFCVPILQFARVNQVCYRGAGRLMPLVNSLSQAGNSLVSLPKNLLQFVLVACSSGHAQFDIRKRILTPLRAEGGHLPSPMERRDYLILIFRRKIIKAPLLRRGVGVRTLRGLSHHITNHINLRER